MKDRRLTGKVAWVTGSSRGIGRVVAGHLASLGATVVVHGTTPTSTRQLDEAESLDAVAAEIADAHGVEVLGRVVRHRAGAAHRRGSADLSELSAARHGHPCTLAEALDQSVPQQLQQLTRHARLVNLTLSESSLDSSWSLR